MPRCELQNITAESNLMANKTTYYNDSVIYTQTFSSYNSDIKHLPLVTGSEMFSD